MHKSRNQVLLALTFCNQFLTMKAVPIGPGTKDSGLELLSCLALLFSIA